MLSGSQSWKNVVVNPTFENGLQGWSATWGNKITNCEHDTTAVCHPCTGKHYACASHRAHGWQGIQQDVTDAVMENVKYKVHAIVRISAPWELEADVIATLKLESQNMSTRYVHVGRIKASKGEWVKLEGTIFLKTISENVIFYLEGPPPGVDLLVDSVYIEPDVDVIQKSTFTDDLPLDSLRVEPAVEIIQNSSFWDGLQHWSSKCCRIFECEAMHNPHIHPLEGRFFAVATNRTESWQGIQQDITGRLEANISYDVCAKVRIHGTSSSSEVMATLFVVKMNLEEKYITLGRVEASAKDWVCLQGRILLPSLPKKAIIYIEGPAAGIDILVDSFSISPTPCLGRSPPPKYEDPMFGKNIILNCDLLRGLDGWYGLGSCTLQLASGAPQDLPPSARDSLQCHAVFSGKYILATDRKHSWQGPAQTITKRIQLYLPYQVSAWVQIGRGGTGAQKVNVALGVDGQWINGGEIYGEANCWKEIKGSFRLESEPKEAMVYVQGPAPHVDLMVANLQIFSVDRTSRMDMLKLQTEKVRKRDVIIQLESENNEPLSSLPVTVKQIENSFPIGSCINRHSLENQDYVNFFLKHFNYAVFENEMKWQWVEPEPGRYNYADADALCEFCSMHNIPMRGHCIFWEVEQFVQSWVKKLGRDELEIAIQNRVADLVSRYSGRIQHYDVNNEMLHGDFYKKNMGSEILAYMFKLVHQFDPSALLFVNDYHVEDGHDADSSPDEYVLQIQSLLLQGAPVGGIGLQGHSSTPIGAILCQALNKLSVLGLPIWLTEVDVSSSNEFVRADDLEVLMREAYAHPAVEGIILWGFWEGCMSRDKAHLVNWDKSLTEAGKRFIDLKNEWMSHLVQKSNVHGKVQFCGFYGSYTVTVKTASGVIEQQFELTKGESPLIISMKI